MEVLKELLPHILLAISIPIAGAIGTLAVVILKKTVSRINNDALQGLAWTAVRFANQKFKNLHGQDKFDKAYSYVASKVKGVSKEDIEATIEAALGSINEGLGNGASSESE